MYKVHSDSEVLHWARTAAGDEVTEQKVPALTTTVYVASANNAPVV
jgi:protoporphyrinogen oxidase